MKASKTVINSWEGTSEDLLEKMMHELILKESAKATLIEKGGLELWKAGQEHDTLGKVSNCALYGKVSAVETRTISCEAELKRIFRLTSKSPL